MMVDWLGMQSTRFTDPLPFGIPLTRPVDIRNLWLCLMDRPSFRFTGAHAESILR